MEIVGRVDVVARVRTVVDTAGGALLLGPPGIGKTAVATALVAQQGGVVVGLEDATTADEVRVRLARALGCPVDRQAAVLAALSDVPLLVLDGVEGCLQPVEEQLDALCAAAPVVVTSRRRGDPPVPVIELGPLEPASGAALLRTRVGSADQATRLDEDELRALSTALDGVPLALELAATRLRLHPPSALMDRPLPDLEGPRLAPRQRLSAEIGASVEATSEAARAALRWLSVVPVPVDAVELAQLAGEPVDEALLELLDAALVHPLAGQPPRFRVLGPIRQVGRRGLDEAVRQAGLRRLAGTLLDQVEAPEAAVAHDAWRRWVPWLQLLLDSDDDPTRLRAALALARHHHRLGRLHATLAIDEGMPAGGPEELRGRWDLDVAAAAHHLGDLDRARTALERVDVPALQALRRSAEAGILADEGAFDEALALMDEVRARSDDPRIAFRAGAVHMMRDELDRAADAFREARRVDDPFREAQASYALCACLRDAGAPPDEVLAEVEREVPFPWLAPRFDVVRAVVLADRGDLEEAREGVVDAARALLALGEADDHVLATVMACAIELASGSVPEGLLRPVAWSLSPRVDAALALWRAIVHGALGHLEAARALGLPAIERLRVHDPLLATELGAALAVTLVPAEEGADAVLDELPADDPLVASARRIAGGQAPEEVARLEHRVQAGLARLVGARTRVAIDGTAFVGPDGIRVALGRRRVLKRMVAALASGEGPWTVEALCEAVWPGEALVGDSGTRRVHVAISSLRKLGLRGALVTGSDENGDTAWTLLGARVDDV